MRILRILFKFGASFVKRMRQIARKVWFVIYGAIGLTMHNEIFHFEIFKNFMEILKYLPGYLPGTAVPGGDSGSGLGPCGYYYINPWIGPSCHFCIHVNAVWKYSQSQPQWRGPDYSSYWSEKKYSRTSLLVQCLVNFRVSRPFFDIFHEIINFHYKVT